jgi:Tfp pilus assembly protein PilO
MHIKNSRPVSILVTPGLVFSCSVLLSLALVQYGARQWETLKANSALVTHLRNSNFTENATAALLKQLAASKDSLNEKYLDLMGTMGGPEDLSGVLHMIIAKANAADIPFVKMQPQTETKSGPAGAYPMILELTASFYSYGRFIAALEAYPSLLRIDRIAITAQKNGLLDIRTLITCSIQTKP